jgi:hypothetical protein
MTIRFDMQTSQVGMRVSGTIGVRAEKESEGLPLVTEVGMPARSDPPRFVVKP